MKRITCIVPALTLALLVGCVGVKQPRQSADTYMLEYDAPLLPGTPALPFVVNIEPFATAPGYDSDRMAVRQKTFQRRDYAYHKWRAEPGRMVAGLLARDFVRASLFKAAVVSESVPAYSHILTGMVDEFYQDSAGETWEAVLAAGITLSALSPGAIQQAVIFQKRYAYREPCSQNTPAGFVEAMSLAVKRFSAEAMADVHQELKKQIP